MAQGPFSGRMLMEIDRRADREDEQADEREKRLPRRMWDAVASMAPSPVRRGWGAESGVPSGPATGR